MDIQLAAPVPDVGDQRTEDRGQRTKDGGVRADDG